MTWETQSQPAVPGRPVQPRPEQDDPLSHYQTIRISPPPAPVRRAARPPRRSGCWTTCGCLGLLLIVPVFLLLAYLLAPFSTNFLILGVDRSPEGTYLGRTDTMMLVSVNPLLPRVRMLSIPRDLWIPIPGVGENRINTVHFFAEANQPGSGPAVTTQVVSDIFRVPVRYYTRVRFDGVVQIVDAMGGVDINMPEAMSGYEAGWNHLTGEQALAFARDRKGTDDFFRMAHGQLLIKSLVRQSLLPTTWVRAPRIAAAVFQMVDTNLPIWHWPRIGLALARAVLFGGIDSRTLDRQMAAPFVTNEGAQVLLPNWDLINPLVREMFGS